MRLSYLLIQECLGVPYIWGGNNPMTGLDCSGFVQWVLKKMDMLEKNKDYTAQDIHNTLVENCAISNRVKADCALFFGPDRFNITHVAISINDEWMAEAAHGDSHCLLEQHAIDKGARVEFNRINRRKDLVSCLYLNSEIIN